MATKEVLFLGGPAHGRRQAVESYQDGRLHAEYVVPTTFPPQYLAPDAPPPVDNGLVMNVYYDLRGVAPGGPVTDWTPVYLVRGGDLWNLLMHFLKFGAPDNG